MFSSRLKGRPVYNSEVYAFHKAIPSPETQSSLLSTDEQEQNTNTTAPYAEGWLVHPPIVTTRELLRYYYTAFVKDLITATDSQVVVVSTTDRLAVADSAFFFFLRC